MQLNRALSLPLLAGFAAVLLAASQAWACSPRAMFDIVSADQGAPGSIVTVSGRGFDVPKVQVHWGSHGAAAPELDPMVATVDGSPPAYVQSFSIDITVPNAPPGDYILTAVGIDGQQTFAHAASSTFTVIGTSSDPSTKAGAGSGTQSAPETSPVGPQAAPQSVSDSRSPAAPPPGIAPADNPASPESSSPGAATRPSAAGGASTQAAVGAAAVPGPGLPAASSAPSPTSEVAIPGGTSQPAPPLAPQFSPLRPLPDDLWGDLASTNRPTSPLGDQPTLLDPSGRTARAPFGVFVLATVAVGIFLVSMIAAIEGRRHRTLASAGPG